MRARRVAVTGGSDLPSRAGRRREAAGAHVGLVEMVRRANAPLPAEHSVTFRIATAVAVLTGILACAAVGEVSVSGAILASAASLAGMAFSYRTRTKPWQWVKVLLAIAVLAIFASFVLQVISAAHVGQLTSIEVPLASLFVWVQVIHSFDVPARRDLLFSLAAAGALLTLGAAQAVSVGFLAYVAVWLGACLVALGCSWRSMTGGAGPLALGSLVATGLVIVLAGAGFLVVLPAPRAAQAITLPSSLISFLPLRDPNAVTGTGAQSTEPAQAGKASGSTGVGGYLGFASELDIATRGALGDEVIMRVRADRPGYFLGMTYDTWDGQNWKRSAPTGRILQLTSGSPFEVASAWSSFPQLGAGTIPSFSNGELASGPVNVQTFYVAQPIANLLFATPDPTEVYFPEHSLILGADGSMRSTIAMTPGTVYTVVSTDEELAPAVLAKDQDPPVTPMLAALEPDLELPAGRYASGRSPRPPDRERRSGDDDIRQGDRPRGLDGRPSAVLDRYPAPAPRPGCRQPVPLRLAGGLLRADLDSARSHAAHARCADARGDRVRAGAVRPSERSLRDPGQGRARLGAGVVPGSRLAELRPDRTSVPGTARPRCRAALRPRPCHRRAPMGAHRRRPVRDRERLARRRRHAPSPPATDRLGGKGHC